MNLTQDQITLITIGVIAYLIGNINPSIIIAKLHGVNIRKEGSGNAGTTNTNTIRVLGLGYGIAVLVIDVLKGFIAVEIGNHMGGMYGAMVAFAAVVVGHCFPVLFKFKGGKGVAASFGAALAFNWPSALCLLLVAAAFFIVTRRMSVASIFAALSYPTIIWLFNPDAIFFAMGMGGFIILMHIPNIIRLFKGEEKALTVGSKGKKSKGKKSKAENEPVAELSEEIEETADKEEPEVIEPVVAAEPTEPVEPAEPVETPEFTQPHVVNAPLRPEETAAIAAQNAVMARHRERRISYSC